LSRWQFFIRAICAAPSTLLKAFILLEQKIHNFKNSRNQYTVRKTPKLDSDYSSIHSSEGLENEEIYIPKYRTGLAAALRRTRGAEIENAINN
jgi:hypothetical protein